MRFVDAQGFQYELGDFHIKAGRAVLAHTENLRGIVLEVCLFVVCLVILFCSEVDVLLVFTVSFLDPSLVIVTQLVV